jgi:hypothetical protein
MGRWISVDGKNTDCSSLFIFQQKPKIRALLLCSVGSASCQDGSFTFWPTRYTLPGAGSTFPDALNCLVDASFNLMDAPICLMGVSFNFMGALNYLAGALF